MSFASYISHTSEKHKNTLQHQRRKNMQLRPFLMLLDLFVVRWKGNFQHVRMRFAPKMLEIGLPPQNESAFSPRCIQNCFPLLQGPCCRKSPSALFRSNRVKYDWWFPAIGPLEKRQTALDRSWRKLRVILRRGRSISDIFGANVHANVLKATFSTDCKSNCVRIGLIL